MRSATGFAIVLVTAPDVKVARALAESILQARLAACVNLVPQLESHYWWQGRLERGKEILLVIKTGRKLLRPLEQLVLRKHPYDTPEFLALSLAAGTEKYLQWMETSLRSNSKSPQARASKARARRNS